MVEDKYFICNNWYFGRTAKIPTMTVNAKADKKGLGSLEGHVCTVGLGTQANNYTRTKKAIAECMGRVHGNEM